MWTTRGRDISIDGVKDIRPSRLAIEPNAVTRSIDFFSPSSDSPPLPSDSLGAFTPDLNYVYVYCEIAQMTVPVLFFLWGRPFLRRRSRPFPLRRTHVLHPTLLSNPTEWPR